MRFTSRCALTAALLAQAAVAQSQSPAGAGTGGMASIAFVSIRSGDPQIHVRDANGQMRVLTEGKGLYSQPAWSVDGRMAYGARVGTMPRIFVTDANGAAPKRLSADELMESAPSWSPDGRWLAYFARPVTVGQTELRLVELSTGKVSVVASNERSMGPARASWSADGTRLAFNGVDVQNRAHVWTVRRDGSELRNLSAAFAPRGGFSPDLSPDGKRVAWVADMRGRKPIVVTDIDSGESRDLMPDQQAGNESPRWSPDGRQITFASIRDSLLTSRNDVFVMDASGANIRNLSRHEGEDFDPKWAADGRSIVFASLRSGTSLLYEVSLIDGAAKPISVHASHDMDHVIRPLVAAQ